VTDILKNWDMIMGIVDWSLLEEVAIPENITALAQERIEAKKNKDYSRADSIRKEIEDAGYVLVDTKEGFVIEKR
jgi:cysteinyl-tRNA synthetase